MSKRQRAGIGWFLAVALAGVIPAQEQSVERSIRDFMQQWARTESAAVVLLSERTLEWQTGGQLTEKTQHLVNVRTEAGRRKYGEYPIYFQTGREEIEILRAGTYTSGMEFTPVDPKAISDEIPPELAGAPLYPDVAMKVVRLPGVSVGSLLEVQVKKTRRDREEGFSGTDLFQSGDPMQENSLHIRVPRGKTLGFRLFNGAGIQSVRTTENQIDHYAFYLPRSAAIPEEPATPDPEWFAPRIVFSAYADWAAAARPFSVPYWERIGQRPRTAAFTADLLRGEAGPLDKLARIFQFITREVRNVEIALPYSGYAPHSPDEILAGRLGDAKDKAMLLGAMLGEAGFPAVPVFVNSGGVPLAEDVPALEQFDRILQKVTLPDGSAIYLDPFAEYDTFPWCSYAQGNRGLRVDPSGCALEGTHGPAGKESLALNSFVIRLAAGGGAGFECEASLSGSFSAGARWLLRDRKPDELRQFFARAAAGLAPGAVVRESKVDGLTDCRREVTIRQTMEASDFTVMQGNLMVVEIPEFPLDLAEVRPVVGPDSRKTPLSLSFPIRSVTRLEIRLPDGFDLLYMPAGSTRETDAWSARKSFQWQEAPGIVTVEREIRLTRNILPPASYPEIRDFFRRLADRQDNILLLRLRGKDGSSGKESP